MMKRLLIGLLFLPIQSWAMTYWVGDGGYKVPQEDLPPSTTSQFWHDGNAYMRGGRNTTQAFVLYLGNDTSSDISNVSVTLSSFTGSTANIISVTVSSGNVWDTTTRPTQQFVTHYLPIEGLSKLTWGNYDQHHLPARFQLPCTMSGGQCTANGGTVWADRPDHDKHYPEILVPSEIETSFTVYASSSQAVWFDTYLSTSLPAGSYTAYARVYVNSSLTQTIPVYLTVLDFTLPQVPQFKSLIYIGSADVSERMNGERWPASHQVEPYYTTRKRFIQMAHAHGMVPYTDDNLTTNVPYPLDLARLNGTLYSATTGYGNARGIDTGDTVYAIGTYGQWGGVWGTTASAIKPRIRAWTDYFAANFPDVRAFWYIADETLTDVETYASYVSTFTSGGYRVNTFITYEWPDVQSSAPSINLVSCPTWLHSSTTTWANAWTYYHQGLTPGTTEAFAYNGVAPWSGTHATEDDGVTFSAIYWSASKKDISMWLYWAATYYDNYQGGMGDTDLWHNAQTFGGYSSTDSQLGKTGWNYTNGDGVLMYPGTDAIYTSDSRAVNAPFASWRLKLIRKGIEDADMIAMARQANQSAADAIVNAAVPSVLYELPCTDPGDCTYYRGSRTWSSDPVVWETARQSIQDLIPEEGGEPYCGDSICNGSDTCSNCPGDCGVCSSGPSSSFGGSFRFSGGALK